VEFEESLLQAKEANRISLRTIIEMYRPLIIKESFVDGFINEDLQQNLIKTVLLCIRAFNFNKYNSLLGVDKKECFEYNDTSK
jgi:hypothetical protein